MKTRVVIVYLTPSSYYLLIDVRTLVNNDEGLQDGILQALEQYNTEQHITVTLPGSEQEVEKKMESRDESLKEED
jgi:succinyl-CoA synthetase beta subunit